MPKEKKTPEQIKATKTVKEAVTEYHKAVRSVEKWHIALAIAAVRERWPDGGAPRNISLLRDYLRVRIPSLQNWPSYVLRAALAQSSADAHARYKKVVGGWESGKVRRRKALGLEPSR